MSDPRFIDPRLAETPSDQAKRRLAEDDSTSPMWVWVAGGVLLALLLVFVFGRTPAEIQQPAAKPQMYERLCVKADDGRVVCGPRQPG